MIHIKEEDGEHGNLDNASELCWLWDVIFPLSEALQVDSSDAN